MDRLLSVKIDERVKKRLFDRAKEESQTPSLLVRTVIDHYLGLSEQELSGVLRDVSATANTLKKARAARDMLMDVM